MTFLKDHWKDIQSPDVIEGVSLDAKAQGYIRPWNHDKANMDMLRKAIRILRPTVVIELGTFEGLGTEIIATEMSNCVPEKSVLWTFDAGKPTLSDWPEQVRDEIVEQWSHVEEARAERINKIYDRVEIVYIEGLTKDTLPRCIQSLGYWNFCFQDSVHDFDNIMIEWKLLRECSSAGSVIVFDDIIMSHPFRDYFFHHEELWDMRHTEIGRSQLWAERRI